MKNLDTQFVERTIHLINDYQGDLDFTMILNCTLGLIILPLEVNKNKPLDFLNRSLNEVEVINSIFSKDPDYIFNPTIRDRNSRGFKAAPHTLKTFLIKTRNSLAHFANSVPINEGNEWKKLILKDINRANNNNVEMQLTFSKEGMKEFALFIAKEYLREQTTVRIRLLKNNI